MGFVGMFWKNNIEKAYLPKTTILNRIKFRRICIWEIISPEMLSLVFAK